MNKSAFALFLLFAGIGLSSCSASESGTTGGCGDGLLASGEQCDGTDFGGKTCADLGFSGGDLACNAACVIDTAACCKDECVNLGDTMCQGDQIMTCGKSAGGCRAWVQTTDCAANGQTCNSTGGNVACKGNNCVDSCQTAGALQCNGAAVEKCETQANGCLGWTPTEDCALKSQTCVSTAGSVQCGACPSSTCTLGDQQCTGNVLQTCSDVGGCTTWADQKDCGVEGLSCVASGGVFACKGNCTDTCGGGLKICKNNSVIQCEIGSNGCFDWVTKETCTTNDQICQMGSGGTKCVYDCSNPCPTLGEKRCNANTTETCTQLGNCQEWKTTSTCPLGQACDDTNGNFSCVAGAPTGEDCGHVIVVKAGTNTINWTATKKDYVPASPACLSSYYSTISPDVVLAYQSQFTGTLEYTLPNPTSSYWVIMASGGTCGDLTTPVSCQADWSDNLTDSISVTSGSTYFFYVAPTDDLSTPLDNPLTLQLTEIDCTAFQADTVSKVPANGATTTSLSQVLTVVFETAVNTTAGTVTLTGDKGTSLSYTVGTSTEITFSSDHKTMTVTPAQAFKAGEKITVTWSGITDVKCTKAIAPANWTFTVVTPPCAPGQNGMIAGTLTKTATGYSGSPYYMAVDSNAGGWIYLGSTSTLERVSKNGSNVQNVVALAGLSSSTHIGYEAVVHGNDIFTVDNKYGTSTVGYLWRISSDGGSTWNPQDMASFTTAPTDDFDGASYYKGKMYMVDSVYTGSTHVYSVPVDSGTPPQAATLETTLSGTPTYCSGLAVDDLYFYVACSTTNGVMRVDRSTGTTTLLSNAFSMSTTKNSLYAADTNNDGKADYLYFRGYSPNVAVVCDPSGTPYVDTLVTWTTSSSNYGMAYDATANELWLYDTSTDQLVNVK